MSIFVHGFKKTYPLRPIKAESDDQPQDDKGYKLDAKKQRILERQVEDWVIFSPKDDLHRTRIIERVRHLNPDNILGIFSDDAEMESNYRYRTMCAKWSIIEPAYKKWLERDRNHEIDGMPLDTVPFLSDEDLAILYRANIKTAEQFTALKKEKVAELPIVDAVSLQKKVSILLKNVQASDNLKLDDLVGEKHK